MNNQNQQGMNAENRYRWMILAIIVLGVLNITTVLTIVYHRKKAVSFEVTQRQGQFPSDGASMRFSGRFFRDQLDLSSLQMSHFKQFNPVFRQQVRQINTGLIEKRTAMLLEMSGAEPDTARLEMLSDSIGLLHANLKVLTYRYYLDFKKICNNKQKEKLDQLFGEMFAADIQTGRYGPGPGGRGRGRRINN